MNYHLVPTVTLFTSLFAIPIIATLYLSSTNVNFIGAYLMVVVAGAAYSRMRNSRAFAKRRLSGVSLALVLAVLSILAGWLAEGIEFWSSQKIATYLGAGVLYLVFSRVFAYDQQSVMLLAKSKLFVVAWVSVFFLMYIYFTTVDSVKDFKMSPPLLNHLRHLNYELYFGMVLAVYGLISPRKHVALIALLFIFVFLTVWSGGRGSVMAVLAALAFLAVFARYLPILKISAVILAFAISATAIVFATGEQQVLMDTIGYSINMETNQPGANPDQSSISMGQFTAGRTGMWRNSINTVLSRGPLATLTGLGPDAFQKYQISPGYVHPHNSLVQAFMEFGLIGLTVFTVILLRFISSSIVISRFSSNPAHALAGAMFFGGVVFSMVDGIFHHIAPLAMMIFAMALIQSVSAARILNQRTSTMESRELAERGDVGKTPKER